MITRGEIVCRRARRVVSDVTARCAAPPGVGRPGNRRDQHGLQSRAPKVRQHPLELVVVEPLLEKDAMRADVGMRQILPCRRRAAVSARGTMTEMKTVLISRREPCPKLRCRSSSRGGARPSNSVARPIEADGADAGRRSHCLLVVRSDARLRQLASRYAKAEQAERREAIVFVTAAGTIRYRVSPTPNTSSGRRTRIASRWRS